MGYQPIRILESNPRRPLDSIMVLIVLPTFLNRFTASAQPDLATVPPEKYRHVRHY